MDPRAAAAASPRAEERARRAPHEPAPAGAARARSRRTRGLVPRPDARQPVPLHSLALAADAAVAARAPLAAQGVGSRICTQRILSAAAFPSLLADKALGRCQPTPGGRISFSPSTSER